MLLLGSLYVNEVLEIFRWLSFLAICACQELFLNKDIGNMRTIVMVHSDLFSEWLGKCKFSTFLQNLPN